MPLNGSPSPSSTTRRQLLAAGTTVGLSTALTGSTDVVARAATWDDRRALREVAIASVSTLPRLVLVSRAHRQAALDTATEWVANLETVLASVETTEEMYESRRTLKPERTHIQQGKQAADDWRAIELFRYSAMNAVYDIAYLQAWHGQLTPDDNQREHAAQLDTLKAVEESLTYNHGEFERLLGQYSRAEARIHEARCRLEDIPERLSKHLEYQSADEAKQQGSKALNRGYADPLAGGRQSIEASRFFLADARHLITALSQRVDHTDRIDTLYKILRARAERRRDHVGTRDKWYDVYWTSIATRNQPRGDLETAIRLYERGYKVLGVMNLFDLLVALAGVEWLDDLLARRDLERDPITTADILSASDTAHSGFETAVKNAASLITLRLLDLPREALITSDERVRSLIDWPALPGEEMREAYFGYHLVSATSKQAPVVSRLLEKS